MICPCCGSRISAKANPCPNCKQVFTSEFGRIPNFPGLAINWIECPWCEAALKLDGTLDVGGDTPRQHRDRRRKTLAGHKCPNPKRYGNDRCAMCWNIITIPTYHEGKAYGSDCIQVIRREA